MPLTRRYLLLRHCPPGGRPATQPNTVDRDNYYVHAHGRRLRVPVSGAVAWPECGRAPTISSPIYLHGTRASGTYTRVVKRPRSLPSKFTNPESRERRVSSCLTCVTRTCTITRVYV